MLEAQHDTDAAIAMLTQCLDNCLASGQVVDLPVFGPDLVRLAVAAGSGDRVADVCRLSDELATANPVPSIVGAALRCRALAADDATALVAAADAYARGPRVLDTALVREEAGRALLRRDEVDAGRSQLTQAVDLYERLGAVRGAMRAEAALRDTGLRRGRRGTRNRPQHGWASLTPTEQTIAGLAAEGLSNPQIAERLFVSHRTVQTHLSHIFGKLDISSRVHLAAETARHH